MAYGKQMFITDTDAHNFLTELGRTVEYVEVIEDGTTFSVYTPSSTATIEDVASAGNKLADASTAANRFTFNAGQVIRIPCKALTLATGAVICFTNPEEV